MKSKKWKMMWKMNGSHWWMVLINKLLLREILLFGSSSPSRKKIIIRRKQIQLVQKVEENSMNIFCFWSKQESKTQRRSAKIKSSSQRRRASV